MIMNNNLFKTLLIPAAACLLGACAESADLDMETGGESGAIRFTGPAVTRTAIDGTADMQTEGRSFSVWGNYTDEEGSTPTSVFTAEKVTYVSGMWGYEGTRYWLPGNTYDFYAWYPDYSVISSAAASVEASAGTGISKITGFDATKGHDLMAATEPGIETVEGRIPEAVSFRFKHLLARVEFVGKIHSSLAGAENVAPRVLSANLYGMSKKGDLAANGSIEDMTTEAINNAWTISSKTEDQSTQTDPFATASNVSLTGEDTAVIDALLFPQEVAATGYMLEITYTTTAGDDAGQKTKIIDLGTLSDVVSRWDAGKHYRYTFTVMADDRIAFDKPTVGSWSSATGGIIIVD